MLNKLKNISSGLLDTVMLYLLDKHRDNDEIAGEEVVRSAGRQLDVLCSTDSKEKIDQDNALKTKRIRFMRFRRGLNCGSKEVLNNWENERNK